MPQAIVLIGRFLSWRETQTIPIQIRKGIFGGMPMDHLTGCGLTSAEFYGLKLIFLLELWAKARIHALRTI